MKVAYRFASRFAYRFTTLTLVMLAVLVGGLPQKAQAATARNLVRGIVGPVVSNTSWSGDSTLALIPGAALIPVTSTQTVFYLGFTAGTTVDIGNIVLYTTPRGSLTVSAVTPVTLGGSSSPSINLGSATVCPVQEISGFNPCIVRLDPTKVVLSALNDYYLVVYFTASDPNDYAIGGTQPSFGLSSLTGWYVSGANETTIAVGGSIPAGNGGNQPYFLMYVMND
jgi:hypothetical protein